MFFSTIVRHGFGLKNNPQHLKLANLVGCDVTTISNAFQRYPVTVVQRLLESRKNAILTTAQKIDNVNIGRIIMSVHSGGCHPAALAVANGGLAKRIREVFLLDAFYSDYDKFLP